MKIFLGIFAALIVALLFTSGCTGTIDNIQGNSIENFPAPTQSMSGETVKQNLEQTNLATTQPTKISDKKIEDKVNGIDKTGAKKIGPYVVESIDKISPLYSNLKDDFTTKDYDKMATDALVLGKYAEERLDEIAIEDKLLNKELFGELSNKDLLIFNKLVGYLLDMREISDLVKLPLSYIKDDPSKITLRDKLDSFSAVMSKSKAATFHFDELMDVCTGFDVDCGQNLPGKKILEKKIEFL